MSSVSVCMIVRDEARSLARCLQSLQGAQQIVVIDTGSVDDTVSIARSFGVELGTHTWRADFADARNAALERARCEWVLVVDADEALPAGGLEILRAESHGPHEGYLLGVDSVAVVKGERIGHTAMVLRFFRNRPEYRFKGRVHEQISESLLAGGGSIGSSRVRLFHDGYDPAVTGVAKQERNLSLLAAMVQDDPRDAYARYKLGTTLAASGRPEEARTELEAALCAIAAAGSSRVYPFHQEVFISLARVLGQGGDATAALEILHRAMATLPRTPQLLIELGRCHATAGAADEAMVQLAAALDLAEAEEHLASEPAQAGCQAGLLAGDLLAERGQDDAAMAMYERAAHFAACLPLDVSPVGPWLAMAVRHLQANRLAEALMAYQEVVRRQPGNLPAQLGLGTLYCERGMFTQAKACFETALTAKPGDPELQAMVAFCEQRSS